MAMSYVFPCTPQDNVADDLRAYGKHSSKAYLRRAIGYLLPDCQDLLGRQFRGWIVFSSFWLQVSWKTLVLIVLCIIHGSPLEEVVRAAAGRVVALVADHVRESQVAIGQLISKTVSIGRFRMFAGACLNVNNAIATYHAGAGEHPTITKLGAMGRNRAVFVNLGPKTISGGMAHNRSGAIVVGVPKDKLKRLSLDPSKFRSPSVSDLGLLAATTLAEADRDRATEPSCCFLNFETCLVEAISVPAHLVAKLASTVLDSSKAYLERSSAVEASALNWLASWSMIRGHSKTPSQFWGATPKGVSAPLGLLCAHYSTEAR